MDKWNGDGEIRFGVIGGEGRGRVLGMAAHRPEEGFRLVAASSLNPEKMTPLREVCGEDIRLTGDYREILADPSITAVFICTPDYLHEQHALEAIDAGKAIYLEKPLAISIAGCDRIIKSARAKGVPLYLGHNMRFFSVIRKMRELILDGRIGEVQAIWCRHFINYGGDAYYKNWNSERCHTHSLLLQKGAHDIDVIHWLAGAYTTRVVGMGKLSVYNRVEDRRAPSDPPDTGWYQSNWPPLSQKGLSPKIDVEDHNMIFMQLENGVQASYLQCHYTPDSCRNYTVIGTEGRIENAGDASTPENWATVHLWNQRAPYSSMGHEVFRIPPRPGGHGGADPEIVADFIRLLRGQPVEGAEPWDARMAVVVGCLGADSLRNHNQPYDIPGPSGA